MATQVQHHRAWEVVCSDGKVRHPPYHNEEDARFDAYLLDTRCDCPSGARHDVRRATHERTADA